jgi:nucleoside 2-deoxyribosyltransferase
MKIYLAAPFFNPAQIAVVERWERLMKENLIACYSPRTFGVIEHLSLEEKKAKGKEVYERNLEMMEWADVIVAVVDGRDSGVIFEMGYVAGVRHHRTPLILPWLVTYTDENHGLNIMLRHAVDGHLVGMEDARLFVEGVAACNLDRAFLSRFQMFNPNVT